MNDWASTFLPMLNLILHGQNPYDFTQQISFINPPWLIPFFLPFFWVPWWLAIAFAPRFFAIALASLVARNLPPRLLYCSRK